MSKRILLVEDNVELANQISSQLQHDGYEVSVENDGDSAACLDSSSYDLVILDLMLPGTYGLDILKQYRRLSDTPVIILSAKT